MALAADPGAVRFSAQDAYLTKAEIAMLLRVSVRSVDTYMRDGLLPYYKIGRSVRFKKTDIDGHFDRHVRKAKGIDARRSPKD